MDLLIWAGKVSIYWLFFYGFFYFFLRKLTYFRWNRLYLLGALLLSLVLPLARIPVHDTTQFGTYFRVLEPVEILDQTQSATLLTWIQVLSLMYWSVIMFRIIRLILKLRILGRIWKNAPIITTENNGVSICLLPDDTVGSFSFFNRIGISRSDYANHFDEILSHEMIHVRQGHSFDILLAEILTAIFWFHPVLPRYKRSLQELHEFLADEQIKNRDTYAEFLVSYTLSHPAFSLANNFYKSSLLKQRIKMLYKNKSSKWNLGFYALSAILSVTLLVFVTACSDNQKIAEPESVEKMNPPLVIATGDTTRLRVEQEPKFPGGETAMWKFLASNIKYPKEASSANISGKVYLQFVVKASGEISNVSVSHGIGYGCDEEAARVIKSMPKWKPGKDKGVPVDVWYQLPINFQLE